MSVIHDIPATIANMNHWSDMILQNPLFVQKLDDYQVTSLLNYLKKLITDESNKLALIKSFNPKEKNITSINLEQWAAVKEVILNDLLQRKQKKTADPFRAKPAAERKKTAEKGGKALGEKKYAEFLKFISDHKIDISQYDYKTLHKKCKRLGSKVAKQSVEKYLERLTAEKLK
jgi:hypothetical protein